MSGNGVILERLSGKKLTILVSILLVLQIAFFLFGALKFPNSTHTETVEGIMCKDPASKNNFKDMEHMYYLRDYMGRINSNCERVIADENRNVILDATANEIVYTFQIPLPRDDRVLRMHRLFQTMTAIMQLQVLFPPRANPHEEESMLEYNETSVTHSIALRAKMAHHTSSQLDDEWDVFASGHISKEFTCVKNPYSLDCDMVQLFELGSVHYEFYAINIKLDERTAEGMLDAIKSAAQENLYRVHELPEARLTLTFIYQTGGFTQMWLWMKTIVFPFVLIVMCWSWNRILGLERSANLLEKNLLVLGLSLTLLNIPLEWFTLVFDMPWILIYSDLRQGIFYAALFTFWIIFCGEHFVDENTMGMCTSMKSYWKYISGVWIGFVCLLGFELTNRGMQLSDPFFSIWDTKNGSNLAMIFLTIASFSAIFYFGLLLFLVLKVFFNFRTKQSQLPAMNRMRRAFYEGIIYRFKFLLIGTLFCAASTIAFFIVNNLNETHWRFNDEMPYLNYNAGFLTGVYGMWNIYVVAVMIFYAPSHKNKPDLQTNETEETVEFVNLQTRLACGTSTTESVLTAFATKISSS